MKSYGRWRACLALWVVFGTLAPVAYASESESPYRRLTEKASVLVTVEFVLNLKVPGGGGDREIESETTCVRIDAEGLLLCSNTELGGYVGLMSSLMGRGGGFNVTATPREIKVIAEAGSEGRAARLLARDTERDLAWVQIDRDEEAESATAPPFLDFDQQTELEVGDSFYRVRRLDPFFGSAPVVNEGVIAAVVERPRRLLVPSSPSSGGFGLPVFSADGQWVGLTVIQLPAAEEQISGLLPGGMSFLSSAAKLQDMVGGLILPAAEVVKATRLARESIAEDEEDE